MTVQTTLKTRSRLVSHVDMYKTFQYKDEVSNIEFRYILKYFNNLLRKSLIYEGKIYTLPYMMGALGVLSRKPTKWKIFDYQHYKETGDKVPRLNLHSSELTAAIRRIPPQGAAAKDTVKFTIYASKFDGCRGLNRELSRAIKNENTIRLYTEYALRQH